MSIPNLLTSFFRLHVIIRLLIIICGVMLFFGSLVHYVEPTVFPTIFEGMWWAIVTASTVGYGDIVPTTLGGKIIGIFLILAGAGFVTFYMVQLSAHVISAQNATLEGKKVFEGKRHIVIIGWNTRTKKAIEQLFKKAPNIKVVLIDRTLKQNPLPLNNVHFIRGDSTQDEVFKLAKIENASAMLITADQNKNELQADMHSILSLIAAKGIQPNIYAIIEILTSEQENNAWRAGANEVIASNTFMSHIMTNSLVEKGMAGIVLLLLDQLHGDKFSYLIIDDTWINRTFHQAAIHFLSERKLLIGVKRSEECFVNPPLSFEIKDGDSFILIEH